MFLPGNGEREKTHKSLIHSWWLSAWGKTYGRRYTIQTEVSTGILVYLRVSYLVHSLQGSWFPASLSYCEWVMLGPPCERDSLSRALNWCCVQATFKGKGHLKHLVFYTLSPTSVRKRTSVC